ncbi:hypothetical protein ACWDO7_18935 [Streptomyces sp. NPDC003656]
MNCVICEWPIKDGEPRKMASRRALNGDPLEPAYSHKRCRRGPDKVPYITAWSSEPLEDTLIVVQEMTGVSFEDETASDRDERGVLWARSPDTPGVGRPLYKKIHPGRQRQCMTDLRCQVCGGPADEDERGVLWLIEDGREDWPGWPRDLMTTHPPICLTCVRVAREQCPHLWIGTVLVRVAKSELCAVQGKRYTLTPNGPIAVHSSVFTFESGHLRWVVAAQLVRVLYGCTLVQLDDEIAARDKRVLVRGREAHEFLELDDCRVGDADQRVDLG